LELSLRSLIACLPLVLALGIVGCDRAKPVDEQASAGNATANVEPSNAGGVIVPVGSKVDRSHKGEALPAMPFQAPGGAPATLASFRGHPLLVNVWATWCAPCVKELPTLDALAVREVGKLAVVAVSQDMGGEATVQPFWKAHGLKALTPYIDGKMALQAALQVNELPVTILYDSKGQEIWRVTGGMDWTGPDAAKLLGEAS
jgi:thiol-disulfide isomerase/thioredoxin